MPYADPVERRNCLARWKKVNQLQHKLLNKYADAAIHANRRSLKYKAPGVLTANDIRDCLKVGVCFYCSGNRKLGIDHRIPLHIGGPNTRENIVCCCHSCNAKKRRLRPDQVGRWAQGYDCCIDCGTVDRKHVCHGRCNRCHMRHRSS